MGMGVGMGMHGAIGHGMAGGSCITGICDAVCVRELFPIGKGVVSMGDEAI